MVEQIILSNDIMSVTISLMGAQMTSVKKYGKELLWQGDPSVWAGQAPVLFPLCGGLKDGIYTYLGKEYSIEKHGFARKSEFKVESNSRTQAVFMISSDEETKKQYPFDFEFRIIYTLNDTELSVEYKVSNLTDGPMYYSVGSHEAYSCPGGIGNYTLLFDKKENLLSNLVLDGLISRRCISLGENTDKLKLSYDLFDFDSVIFSSLKSDKVTLKNDVSGEEISVEFKDHPYLVIWTIKDAEYICIEPWCGMGSFEDGDYDITKRDGINCLKKDGCASHIHKITF
ncbi:MAG: aldose 1-epimerase family protein [Ruminococcaceae bacterium]|nr:aldose 1-epimerase family protein [Oscillospiraceae bacterium]